MLTLYLSLPTLWDYELVAWALEMSSLLLVLLAWRLVRAYERLESGRRQTEILLRSQRSCFHALIEHGSDGIALVNAEGTVLYASPSTCRVLGYTGEELLGQDLFACIYPEDQEKVRDSLGQLLLSPRASVTMEFRCRHKEGAWRWIECTGTNLLAEPGMEAIVVNYRDIEAHKRAEEQLKFLAVTDALTGLGNYRQLIEVIDSELRRSDRTGRPFAMLMLDVDGLKQINDSFGHLVGSHALCRVAAVLRSHCRSIDTAGRYGGDEFTVVLPESNLEVARHVAQRISQHVSTDGEHPPISVSIGVAVYPEDGGTIDLLLNAADRELYEGKLKPAELSFQRDVRVALKSA